MVTTQRQVHRNFTYRATVFGREEIIGGIGTLRSKGSNVAGAITGADNGLPHRLRHTRELSNTPSINLVNQPIFPYLYIHSFLSPFISSAIHYPPGSANTLVSAGLPMSTMWYRTADSCNHTWTGNPCHRIHWADYTFPLGPKPTVPVWGVPADTRVLKLPLIIHLSKPNECLLSYFRGFS